MNDWNLGRLPPQNIEAEEAVIAAAMLERGADDAIPHLKPEDFYREAHQRIWTTLKEMYGKGEKIDLLTVTSEIRAKGELEIIGGAFYLTSLSSKISSADNVKAYIEYILEASRKRQIILSSGSIFSAAYDDTVHSEQLKEALNKCLQYLEGEDKGEDKSIGDIARETADSIFSDAPMGLPVIFSGLEDKLVCYEWGTLNGVGARPSVGKTAFLINTLLPLAEMGVPVALFSLEMTAKQLMMRIVSKVSKVPLSHLRNKKYTLTADEIRRINEAIEYISSLPITIIDKGISTITGLITKFKKLCRAGCKLIGIDYLQLIEGGEGKTRNDQVSSITRIIKNTTKDEMIVTILLSQLSRNTGAEMPTLKDLRDSGAIEQDLDTCTMLHRLWMVGVYTDSEGFSTEHDLDVGVVKNRQGELGNTRLYFEGATVEILEPQPRIKSAYLPPSPKSGKAKKGGVFDEDF